MGTGREVEACQGYKSLVDFVMAVSGDGVEQNEEIRKAFLVMLKEVMRI